MCKVVVSKNSTTGLLHFILETTSSLCVVFMSMFLSGLSSSMCFVHFFDEVKETYIFFISDNLNNFTYSVFFQCLLTCANIGSDRFSFRHKVNPVGRPTSSNQQQTIPGGNNGQTLLSC